MVWFIPSKGKGSPTYHLNTVVDWFIRFVKECEKAKIPKEYIE